MIDKNEIKRLKSLHKKKGRELHKLILIEGKRIIEQALDSKYSILKIWINHDFKDSNPKFIQHIQKKQISLNEISNKIMDKITDTKSPSGVIAIMNIPKGDIKKMNHQILALDNISDPGNLGTIIRTANWFGIKNILLSEDCVDPYNSKVLRSGMGSHFSMNIVTKNLEKQISKYKKENFKIIATDLNTKNTMSDLKINSNNWVILLGNEAHGISKSVLESSDYRIKIPQGGNIESLNVAVTCGILLYHISRIK
tara:strand:- start:10 stop:771 length:762 start_codon:yes stop_codon:yes gene_type:complete